MDQYLKSTFATCLDDARQHVPKRADAKLCLGAFRKFVSDVAIVGKTGGGDWDISRNGIIKNTSEYEKIIFSQFDSSRGCVCVCLCVCVSCVSVCVWCGVVCGVWVKGVRREEV